MPGGIIFDPILGKLKKTTFTQAEADLVESRLNTIETNELKITYFEIITGTSGSITVPAGATLQANEFGASGNAVLAKIDGSSKPIDESPKDAAGNVVTVALNVGDSTYVTSGTYTDGSVALIFAFTIQIKDLVNLTEDNIIGYEQLDERPASDIEMSRVANPTYHTIQDMHNTIHSSGIIDGNGIIDNGDGTFDVPAGQGLLRATDSDLVELLFIEWPLAASQAIPDDTIRYVGVEYNAGVPQVVTKTTDTWDLNTEFPLATLVREGLVIHTLGHAHIAGNHPSRMNTRAYETAPIVRDNRGAGLILGETGTRNITTTLGAIWDRFQRSVVTAKDTSVADTFDSYYKDGGGGFTQIAAESQVNNTQYDDGSGVLQTLSNNRYTVRWVYLETDDHLVMVFGAGEYTSLTAAGLELPPSSIPKRIEKMGLLIGRIIMREGVDPFAALSTAFDTTFAPTAVTDHGDLGGLGDDDHAQYHTDARALTWLGTRDTDDLSEGANLYYTATRVNNEVFVAGKFVDGTTIDFVVTAGTSITAEVIVGAINHDALLNYSIAQHRIINDAGASTTELWSASKISTELAAAIANADKKDGVRTVADANIALTGNQTINGYLTVDGDRVGVVGQTSGEENGIYIADSGAWSRASDMDADTEITNGTEFAVGNTTSTKNGFNYICTTPDPISIGVTVTTWTEIKRIEFGTTAGTAAEGNDSRIPTQDENDAQVGTNGAPSTANPYVTDTDPRNTNERTPPDNSVTLAKLAPGTDGELITWDAAGDPAAVPVGTLGQVLKSNGPGAAPTFQDEAAAAGWVKVVVNESDFTAGATNEAITAFTLAAGAILTGLMIKPITAFSGGASTIADMKVGIAAADDKYLELYDVFQVVSDTEFSVGRNFAVENWGAGTAVLLDLSSDVNVSAFTAGQVELYYKATTIKS